MALKELSAALRERKVSESEAPAARRPRSRGTEPKTEAETRPWESTVFRLEERFLHLETEMAGLRETMDSEVAALRRGLATMAEAVHAVEAALQAEVEQQMSKEAGAADLGVQVKDLRLNVTELLTLKVKPRLVALEREASELRRRLLALPTCSIAGEHTAGCRRSPAVPVLDDFEKAKNSVQEVGEALLDRARREMQRQEEAAQSQVAEHRCIEASMNAASNELNAQVLENMQLAEQKAELLASEVASQVSQSAAEKQLDQALGPLRQELHQLRGNTAEASSLLQAELSETKASFAEASVQLHSQIAGLRGSLMQADDVLRVGLEDARASSTEATTRLHQELKTLSSEAREEQLEVQSLKRGSQEATTAVREGFAKVHSLSAEAMAGLRAQLAETKTGLAEAEKNLQSEHAKVLKLAGHAESEALTAAQKNSRLTAGIRGVEETLERRMQWVVASNSELEASLGHAFAESRSALAHASRTLSAEVVAERCHSAQTEEDMVARLRRFEEAVSDDSRLQADAMEQLNQAIAAAALRRQADERNLVKKVQEALRGLEERRPLERRELVEAAGRAVAEARADLLEELRGVAQQELRREISKLHREVREALQTEVGKLRQECTVSIETQVRQSLAASEGGERRVEAMLRDHRTRERSEARVVANTIEAFCEEQAKVAATKMEERANLAALQAEEQAKVAAAKMEERANLVALQAEDATRQLAQTMQDQSTFAVKLAEATAQRYAARAEERAEEQVQRAKEGVADSCKAQLEELSSDLQSVQGIQAAMQTTVRSTEEGLAAHCQAGERLAQLAEGESCAAVQHARSAQDISVGLRQSLANAQLEWNEMRSELNAFVDEQRVFCGFLDTEQRSYHDLIRQEVTSLSRLVDTSLRIDPGLRTTIEASPMSPAP